MILNEEHHRKCDTSSSFAGVGKGGNQKSNNADMIFDASHSSAHWGAPPVLIQKYGRTVEYSLTDINVLPSIDYVYVLLGD